MIKCLEPVFHQINTILSRYTGDDNVISKLKNLVVIVQVEINKIPDDCEFSDQCRENTIEDYEPEYDNWRDDLD